VKLLGVSLKKLLVPSKDSMVELLFSESVRGVLLHSHNKHYIIPAGTQIFVNYNDSNYVDLTGDDSDDEVIKYRTPIRKRPRMETSPYSSSGGSSSFDFGSSSSSQFSSDSTYAGTSSSSSSSSKSVV